MKIEYRYTEEDTKFFNKFNLRNLYERYSYKIQKTWSRIHACKKELIKLYCKQSNIENRNDCDWGICTNDMTYIPEKMFDCSVGQVRKLRNGIKTKDDDGNCNTCPYFVKEEEIKNMVRNKTR